ncbi:hypothetical protein ACFP65_01305 [Marinilactibacillus sp. GCM10026970]|uniref:hypothetical protein n=1 Tax=Marinilactibacillus sp. GCM10026970 TaxID=3252642 RepID=UPI003619B44D
MSIIKNMRIPEGEQSYGTFQIDAMGDLFFKYEITLNGRPKLLPELLMDDSVYLNHQSIRLNPDSNLFKTAERNLTHYFQENE